MNYIVFHEWPGINFSSYFIALPSGVFPLVTFSLKKLLNDFGYTDIQNRYANHLTDNNHKEFILKQFFVMYIILPSMKDESKLSLVFLFRKLNVGWIYNNKDTEYLQCFLVDWHFDFLIINVKNNASHKYMVQNAEVCLLEPFQKFTILSLSQAKINLMFLYKTQVSNSNSNFYSKTF